MHSAGLIFTAKPEARNLKPGRELLRILNGLEWARGHVR